MNKINGLPPFKRFCVTIGNLPSSYVDSMSYYECIMWLCKFLKEQVIPAVNENAKAVNELINWFNNLDVQDEIDHKLDEMVESGELQEIISEYLNSKAVFGFDNVADMISATNLINGSYAKTMGFYSINDGGASNYLIRTVTNEDDVDGMTIIAMEDESLVAVKIEEDKINVLQYGIKNDGTSIGSKLNDLVPKIFGKTLYFPEGSYNFSESLKLPYLNDNRINIELDHNAKIYSSTSVSSLLSYGYYENSDEILKQSRKDSYITGGIFDCTNATIGILVNSLIQSVIIKDLEVHNVSSVGIQLEKYGSYAGTGSSDTKFNNVNIYAVGNDGIIDDTIGINLVSNCSDIKFNNMFIDYCSKSIVANGAGYIFDNIHIFANKTEEDTTTSAGIGIELKSTGFNQFNNIYFDTVKTGIFVNTTGQQLYMNNIIMFSYKNQYYTELVNCNGHVYSNIYINNLKYDVTYNGSRVLANGLITNLAYNVDNATKILNASVNENRFIGYEDPYHMLKVRNINYNRTTNDSTSGVPATSTGTNSIVLGIFPNTSSLDEYMVYINKGNYAKISVGNNGYMKLIDTVGEFSGTGNLQLAKYYDSTKHLTYLCVVNNSGSAVGGGAWLSLTSILGACNMLIPANKQTYIKLSDYGVANNPEVITT